MAQLFAGQGTGTDGQSVDYMLPPLGSITTTTWPSNN